MISQFLTTIIDGAKQVTSQPRILFVLVLVVVCPVLLTILFQQFQVVATENYATAARLRIGTVHDTTTALLTAIKADPELLSTYVTDILASNQDILDMVIARQTDEGVLIIISPEIEVRGTMVEDPTPYTRSLAIAGQPLTFEFYAGGQRFWDTTSHVDYGGDTWYVVTRQSFSSFDAVMENRVLVAYAALGVTFIFLFGLGYWLVRDIDYKTKYHAQKQKLEEQSTISNLIVHELRAPLTAIQGYASMISERSDAPPPVLGHALRITESSDRLIHLVNDFLEVVRLQSGQLSVTLAPVIVGTILSRVADELRPLATQKKLELEVVLESGRDSELVTDANRLHQVLTNVTSNAIKYTPSGRITIELKDSRSTLEIRVKDTGTGISANDQKKLFAPFFRVQTEYTSGVTGTGLGMWITKQLVERLGGTIGVESIKNVGTNVVITFDKQAFAK